MFAVGRLGSYFARGVYTVSGPFHPFGGAVDIIVVEQPDGSFKSSPWYVRFGKFQGVLKTREKIVSIDVNGVEADFTMVLDHKGEAYFVREIEVEEGECVPDQDVTDQQSVSDISAARSKSCDYVADQIAVTEKKILSRSNSRRERIFGLVFGRRSTNEVVEDGVGMVRLSPLERADYAADLLEVKWSTNLSSSRVACNDVSGDKQVVDNEHSPVELLVRDDEKNSSYNSVLTEEVSMEITSLDTKEVETSSPLDEGVIKERVEMVSEMSRTDDFGLENVDHDVSEENTQPDSVLQCELEASDRKQFGEEVAGNVDATVLSSEVSEESGSSRETSESLVAGLDGLTEQAQMRPNLDNGECEEVHLHLESLHETSELLNEDVQVDIGEDPTSGSCSEQITAVPCELDHSVSHLGKPLGVQEFLAQTITVDPAISSSEEMESQNICSTSIVNTEVEDESNLHMLRSTGHSQELCGDDAIGKVESTAPSESLEVEDGNNLPMSLSTSNSQKSFGDDAMGKIKSTAPSEVSEEGELDEFKVSEVADKSSSDLPCDNGGDKEEKEAVVTNAEVFSSSSDESVQELSTQTVIIDPVISSSKEMESQITGTTSIVNLGVEDGNNLHMLSGSTSNSQKHFGDDAMENIKSNAPSEVSDEEHLFGDLHEFKVADANSSDFVEKGNHLLCHDGGNIEVKGSINTNAEVFSSSSDALIQELSTQIVTVDPAMSSNKEMESQNIGTTSISHLEVEDGNNLHTSLGATGNCQKHFGEDVTEKLKSNAPSEVLDEEQLPFGDLDEFKVSEMADASCSGFVEKDNHLLCDAGGSIEVKGSVNTDDEVFSSSSDVLIQEFSTQLVTGDPTISTSKEMESQNIGTTSIVNLEVEDGNNLDKSLRSPGNSPKLLGDNAMGTVKSYAPAEISDGELRFGELDKFKVSKAADDSSSDFVKTVNHLLCDNGGDKEEKEAVDTNAEVFSSSSDESVQELSAQIVTVDPAMSSNKEMDSQNIGTTSISNLEVEDGNNLHMSLGATGNSQKLFGDDAMVKIKSNAPSEVSDEERLLFGDLDESKVSNVADASSSDFVKNSSSKEMESQNIGSTAMGKIKSYAPSEVSDEEQLLFGDLDEFKVNDMANASSSDFVKNVNHLLSGDEGDKEVEGSVNTNAEVFSSSSDVLVQPSDPTGPEKSAELLTVKSNPIAITKNLDSDDNIGRMTESLPIMWSPTLNHTADETQHPLSQSLDTSSDSLKWTVLCETDRSSNANEDLPFTQEQPDTTETLVTEELKATLSSPVGGNTSQPIVSSSGSWSLWPFSLNRLSSKREEQPAASEKQISDAENSTKTGNCTDGAKSASEPKIVKQILKSTTPTSEQLASLNLKEGGNKIIFTFSTPMLGKQQVDARIYLWKWNTRIVISDVDGTITKSDVLGQFMPLVGMDWSQTGVTHLFSAIKENGYQFLFLSARSISQSNITRQFLFNLKQDGKALPEGPVVISPDGLFPSLFREVIRRAPHEFKIACLETIRDLFPADCHPFYAGFGNRDTDEISYLKVGIPRGKIVTINPKGEIVVNRRVERKSYSSLHALVHRMFPPTCSSEEEDFNDLNFWKLPPPDIDDI